MLRTSNKLLKLGFAQFLPRSTTNSSNVCTPLLPSTTMTTFNSWCHTKHTLAEVPPSGHLHNNNNKSTITTTSSTTATSHTPPPLPQVQQSPSSEDNTYDSIKEAARKTGDPVTEWMAGSGIKGSIVYKSVKGTKEEMLEARKRYSGGDGDGRSGGTQERTTSPKVGDSSEKRKRKEEGRKRGGRGG